MQNLNSFEEEGAELYSLDTRRVLSDEVVASVQSAKESGDQQYDKFLKDWITDCSVDFYSTVSKNNLLFLNEVKKAPNTKGKIESLKSDIQ